MSKLAAIVVLAAVGMLGACSNDGTATSVAPPTTVNACPLLSSSEIERVTGVTPFLQKTCLFDLQDGTTVTATLIPFGSQPADDFCVAGTVTKIPISSDASVCSVGQGVQAHMTVGQRILYVQWIDSRITAPPQRMFVAVEKLLVLAFPRSAS